MLEAVSSFVRGRTTPISLRVLVREVARTRSFLSDALGSTVALADNSGSVTTSYTYEPFGNASSSGASSTNSFQYTGRENDGTGLAFFRARYYSPTLQRFLSEDPIGLTGGDVNLYAYAANQPLVLIDPLGLCGSGFGALLNVMTGRCGFWDLIQPIIQPIQRFYDEHRRIISCTLFATSVLTWPTALAGRSYELWQ